MGTFLAGSFWQLYGWHGVIGVGVILTVISLLITLFYKKWVNKINGQTVYYKKKPMKYGVNKQILLITAGTVWIIAGANILRIGIVTWLNSSQEWMFKIGEWQLLFSYYSLSWFSEDFIINIPAGLKKRKKPVTVLSLSSTVKSWIVMIFMISLGITIRSLRLLPDSFISVFYTGLSIALILTGILFIRYWWLRRKAILD